MIYWFTILTFFGLEVKGPIQEVAKAPLTIENTSTPLDFISNAGQWADSIHFAADIPGGKMLWTTAGFSYCLFDIPDLRHGHHHEEHDFKLRSHRLDISLINSDHNFDWEGVTKNNEYHNYYWGNDESRWKSKVALYKEIRSKNVYDGIDVVFDGKPGSKYEFHLNPYADPTQIVMPISGADSLSIKEGALYIHHSLGTIIEKPPIAYQEIHSEKRIIPCQYILNDSLLSYRLSEDYDPSLPLIIDPELIFATYSGASSDNWGFTATPDEEGNSFVGGIINTLAIPSQDFPVSPGALQRDFAGGASDVVIAKFDSTGAQLLYATYLGGQSAEQPHSFIANKAGDLWILGRTASLNFPVTQDAYDPIYNGGFDIFVSRLSSDGTSLIGSTFIGGNGEDGVNITTDFQTYQSLKYNLGDDSRGEIILGENDQCFIASSSRSANFPTTVGSYQTTSNSRQDAVVFSLNEDLTQLSWSSYLGGNRDDAAYGIIQANNSLYISGGTASDRFAGIDGALARYQGGIADGFVVRFSLDGQQQLAGTYIGTDEYDQAYLVKSDADGDIYVVGQTLGEFTIIPAPGRQNIYYNTRGSQFISKLNAELGEYIYATRFGSTGSREINISITAFHIDPCENVFVAGWGGISNTNLIDPNQGPFGGYTNGMPVTPNALQRTTDGSDFYFMVLEKDGADLKYATFYGGNSISSAEHVDGGTSRFDENGVLYQAVCAGCRGTSIFPATPGAWSETNNSANCNMALIKMDLSFPVLEASFTGFSPDSIVNTFRGCAPYSLSFINTSEGQSRRARYFWNFNDRGITSLRQDPFHTFTEPGVYNVMFIITDNNSCNTSDTAYQLVEVLLPLEIDAGNDTVICDGTPLILAGSPAQQIQWSPASVVEDPTSSNTFAYPDSNMTFYYSATAINGCKNRDSIQVGILQNPVIQASNDTSICPGELLSLNANGASSYLWTPDVNALSRSGQTIQVSPIANTRYIVSGTDQNGCQGQDTVLVNMEPVPQLNINIADILCESEAYLLKAMGANEFIWSTGEIGPEIIVSPTAPLQIFVSALDQCAGGEDTLRLNGPPPLPEADFAFLDSTYIAPASIQLQNQSINASGFYWSIPNLFESFENIPSISLSQAGTYELQLIAFSEAGCTDTISREITLEQTRLFIPNAFTPNGDNYNDLFEIAEAHLSEISFQIFDQWGRMVFESKDKEFAWDGYFQGKILPEGVYTYIMQAIGINQLRYEQTGTITLIR